MLFFSNSMLEILGRVVVILIVVLVALLVSLLLLCFVMLRTKRIFFPNFVLFIVSLFYEILCRLLSFFRVDPTLIDRVSVEMRNALNYADFAVTDPRERILLLPQCIRSTDCPAKLNSIDGFHCTECGRCAIGELSALSREAGIKMYTSPGGTFTERILMRSKPKAVVGVSCYPNLYEGLLKAKLMGVPAQGVPLSVSGCVNTTVDCEEIIKKCKI
ncbi:MAG TPA: DUF116 domain-containing protein [Candidatus Methanoperedenaceae archaeon]|nr:DUF116 domain-containing protein [Candidatus Methanoperedenaceae archaeon]